MDHTDRTDAGRPARAASRVGPTASVHIDDTGIPGTARVSACGELDRDNCDLIPMAVTEAVAGGAYTITIDLADVTFIDAASVTALLAAADVAAAASATLRLTNAAGIVARVLTIAEVPYTPACRSQPVHGRPGRAPRGGRTPPHPPRHPRR